jgi:hypothetical protein
MLDVKINGQDLLKTISREIKNDIQDFKIKPFTKLKGINEDFNVYDWESGEARFITNDRNDGWNGNLEYLRSILICIDHELIHLNRKIKELESKI